jgi:hypothetical protein
MQTLDRLHQIVFARRRHRRLRRLLVAGVGSEIGSRYSGMSMVAEMSFNVANPIQFSRLG